jgi:hypothetical protein
VDFPVDIDDLTATAPEPPALGQVIGLAMMSEESVRQSRALPATPPRAEFELRAGAAPVVRPGALGPIA